MFKSEPIIFEIYLKVDIILLSTNINLIFILTFEN